MQIPLAIRSEQFGFSIDGARFTPLILDFPHCEVWEECNVVTLSLDASPASDLNWSLIDEKAKEYSTQGKYLFWDIDLGLGKGPLNLHDPSLFSSLSVALKHFIKTFWENYSAQTFGICLYRGTIEFHSILKWNALHEEHLQERSFASKELYALEVLAEYLHQLAAILPLEAEIFALFDATSNDSSAFLAYLLSKEHFSHIQIGVFGAKAPIGSLQWKSGKTQGGYIGNKDSFIPLREDPKIGVVLPLKERIDQNILYFIDDFFPLLESNELEYRIISEAYLTEEWDGLDFLIIYSEYLSFMGKRKLSGFIAAGGRAVVIGKPVGTVGELEIYTFLENRGRGI